MLLNNLLKRFYHFTTYVLKSVILPENVAHLLPQIKRLLIFKLPPIPVLPLRLDDEATFNVEAQAIEPPINNAPVYVILP